MNSFSHYAFGSVAEWMFQHAVGIDTGDAGYRNIIIKPAISKEMDYINGSYKSINGNISSTWNWKGREVQMNIEIPVNTTAKVYIPTSEISNIKEGNKAISKESSIKILESNGQGTILEIGSGTYSFRVKGVR